MDWDERVRAICAEAGDTILAQRPSGFAAVAPTDRLRTLAREKMALVQAGDSEAELDLIACLIALRAERQREAEAELARILEAPVFG